jgi:hypothetical protein
MKKKNKETKKKKQKVVKKLVPKAGLAIKNEFYLEASWILSTIIESKLRRILTLMMNENPGLGFGLQKCLRRIKFLERKGAHPFLVKHFESRLIDELRAWANHRNHVYKNLIDTHVSKARIKKMAEEGILLYQELNTVYKNFKKDWTREVVKVSSSEVGTNEPTIGK